MKDENPTKDISPDIIEQSLDNNVGVSSQDTLRICKTCLYLHQWPTSIDYECGKTGFKISKYGVETQYVELCNMWKSKESHQIRTCKTCKYSYWNYPYESCKEFRCSLDEKKIEPREPYDPNCFCDKWEFGGNIKDIQKSPEDYLKSLIGKEVNIVFDSGDCFCKVQLLGYDNRSYLIKAEAVRYYIERRHVRSICGID